MDFHSLLAQLGPIAKHVTENLANANPQYAEHHLQQLRMQAEAKRWADEMLLRREEQANTSKYREAQQNNENRRITNEETQQKFLQDRQKNQDDEGLAGKVSAGQLRQAQSDPGGLLTHAGINPDQGLPTVHSSAGQQFVPTSPQEQAQMQSKIKEQEFNDRLRVLNHGAQIIAPGKPDEQKQYITSSLFNHIYTAPTLPQLIGQTAKDISDKQPTIEGKIAKMFEFHKRMAMDEHPNAGAEGARLGAETAKSQYELGEEKKNNAAKGLASQLYAAARGKYGANYQNPEAWQNMYMTADAALKSGQMDPDTHQRVVNELRQEESKFKGEKTGGLADFLSSTDKSKTGQPKPVAAPPPGTAPSPTTQVQPQAQPAQPQAPAYTMRGLPPQPMRTMPPFNPQRLFNGQTQGAPPAQAAPGQVDPNALMQWLIQQGQPPQ